MGDIAQASWGAGSLTGSFYAAQYSPWAVNGRIQRVFWDFNTSIDSNGSVYLFESGTNTRIHGVNGFSADVNAYPVVRVQDSTNATVSGTTGGWFEKPITQAPLYMAASGLGSAYAIGNVTVYYEVP